MIKVTIMGLNTASSRGNRAIFQGEIGRFKFVFSVEEIKSSFPHPWLVTASKKELYGNPSKKHTDSEETYAGITQHNADWVASAYP